MYEIGRVFWNEGVDLTHNPEFTLYMYDLMEMMENLLEGMAKYLNGGSMIVKYYPEGKDGKELMLDFKMPWKRYDMIKTLEKKTGVQHQCMISVRWSGHRLVTRCVMWALMHGTSSGVLVAWHSADSRHAHRIEFKLCVKLG
ncbi:hypothetical protein BDR03DRAFT_978421 [Suillus americanus]|nr:hypothetical protein BDR03DRAFT_978421 [Suillus americanus]